MKKTCTFFCCNYIPTKGLNQRQLIFKGVNIPNDVFFALQLTDMNTSILKHRSLSLRAWPIRAHHIARPVDVFNKRLLKRQRPDNPSTSSLRAATRKWWQNRPQIGQKGLTGAGNGTFITCDGQGLRHTLICNLFWEDKSQ